GRGARARLGQESPIPETTKRPAHTAKAYGVEMFPTRSQARPSVKSMTAPAARRRVGQSQWLKVTRSSRPDRITSPPRGGAPIGGSQHRLCHRDGALFRARRAWRRRKRAALVEDGRPRSPRLLWCVRDHKKEARPAPPRGQKPG